MNVNGQTLHSTFFFSFGDDHYSLTDQKRDTKRAMFKNLQFIIIDEVSMVKADQVSSEFLGFRPKVDLSYSQLTKSKYHKSLKLVIDTPQGTLGKS